MAAVLILVGVALWRFLPHTAQQVVPAQPVGAAQNTPAIPVVVQAVAPTLSPQVLEVTGAVHFELESPLSAKIMARVQSVLVREGDAVRHGQPLILLDARDLDASLLQANANLSAASIGYENARIAAHMEASLSKARIAEAQSKVGESEAALQAATAKLQLVQAGPRRQEREQAALAVGQARSNFILAESNLKRMAELYRGDAISAQQYEQMKSQYEVAKSQLETAQQSRSIAEEGNRIEEIRAATQVVRQAQAAVQEADAGLKSAQAAALQTEVRKREIQGAQAQIGQSQAGLRLAKVARDYAVVVAPFDGVVTKRAADPGMMAAPGLSLLTVQGGALRLEAVVPESVLRAVSKGTAVPVVCDALKSKTLTGHVAEIAPQGDPSSHTFIVKIDLPSGSGATPGMFGRARFTVGTEKRLLVPASALTAREGLDYLYVVDADHFARLRMVTVGDPIGAQVPVLSGLNPGERIVASGRERMTDGSPVAEEAR